MLKEVSFTLIIGNGACYAALKSKETRFDGRFFVGVSSTGIYCRPVCRARLPKAENCTFFATAAAAEKAGFRPCLLCRPELAPAVPAGGAGVSLAQRLAQYLADNCGQAASLAKFCSRFGCTEEHLAGDFIKVYNVSPEQYRQTCRLLLAKSLLTDTNLVPGDIAVATGFSNAAAFHEFFQRQYRLPLEALRRKAGSVTKKGGRSDQITLQLGYRPPYCWERLLDFFAQRAIPGVEIVRDGAFLRTVHLKSYDQRHLYGCLKVTHRPQRNTVAITVDTVLLPVLPQVLSRVRRQFDLDCDPEAVSAGLAPLEAFQPGLCVPGTRVPGSFDVFEMAVRAVLGQQITVKAARTLAGRFAAAFGIPLQTGDPGLTHTFPLPETILALEGPIADHLGPLGIIATRANTILALARTIVQGTVDYRFYSQAEEEINKLKALPGIGDWTAHYLAMRALGWPDAFLHTDYGIKKALAPRAPKEILALAEEWRPWRSYAAINLWNSL